MGYELIQSMTEAARLAREADYQRPSSGRSTELGKLVSRTIEVLVTELGWVVRGLSVVEGYRLAKSEELPWPVFADNPSTLPNVVRLIDRALRDGEREVAP